MNGKITKLWGAENAAPQTGSAVVVLAVAFKHLKIEFSDNY